jgi:hypothetical protein
MNHHLIALVAGLLSLAQEVVPPPRPPGATEPAKPAPKAPPTEPTRVVLDFQAKPIAQVIRTLSERTGGMVDTFNTNDARWSEPITLASPDPVAFWEAVDRLTAAANLMRSVTHAGALGMPRPRVQFSANFGPIPASASAGDGGLVAYVGPFRVGPVAVHEQTARVFHAPPASPAAPAPTPPFYVEIALMAEPDVMALQAGPPRKVEAVDDAGRSLVAPRLAGEVGDDGSSTYARGVPGMVRIPLARAATPSKALATLRASVPLEVARRPASPALDVPLEGSAGKTFREGDLAVTVREYRAGPGSPSVGLTARYEGRPDDPPARSAARLSAAFTNLIELADARGNPVHVAGGRAGMSGEGRREFAMDYTFLVTPEPGRGLPTRLRIYRAEWVAWDLPIEFRDVPLP